MEPISRRTFLKLAGLAAIGVAGGLAYEFIPGAKTVTHQAVRSTKAAAAHYELTSDVDMLHLWQVITADSRTSRTISWQSALSEEEAVVEYRLKDAEDAFVISAGNETFTDDDTMTYLHTATIQDLKPGTAYEYRIGYGDKRSDWYPLHTAEGSDFKALIFPDSQSSDYSVWRDTAVPAYERNQDAQFYINMGDLVDNGQDHYQWSAWFGAIEKMASAIPIAPIPGNHETYNRDWKVRFPEAYVHYFSLPDNGLKKYKNQFYTFDYGDINFICLDTQFTEMEQFQPSLEADEVAWLKDDAAKTDKKWKIIVMHKDPLQYAFNPAVRSGDRQNGFSAEGETFMPIFDQIGVDVVLSAHLHTYRNRGHIRQFKRDPAGPLYILTGVAGNVRYPSLWATHPLDEYVPPQPETDNYMVMEATKNKLTFQCFLPDGTLLDTASVEK